MGKLGEMASGRNEKWPKMKLGETTKGQDRYWVEWEKGKVGKGEKEWAKREKFRRNGNGQNGIGRTGNKPFDRALEPIVSYKPCEVQRNETNNVDFV